jgi:hypothetical protein
MNRISRSSFFLVLIMLGHASPAFADQATVHIVWPCSPFDAVMSESLKPDYTVLVDGKPRLKTTTCHHKTLSVSPGPHAFRIQIPGPDIGAIFGDGPPIKLGPGDNLYLGVVSTYGGGAYLRDIGSQKGKAEIEAIKRF